MLPVGMAAWAGSAGPGLTLDHLLQKLEDMVTSELQMAQRPTWFRRHHSDQTKALASSV
jgi:hypothetical protein